MRQAQYRQHETRPLWLSDPMMSAEKRPQSLNAFPYARIRDQLKTGDLVLFSGRTIAARLVRACTGSRWSHIGMVVRLPEFADTPLLWEATRASKVPDIHRGQFFDGVQLVPLDAKVASYPGEVAVRRLIGVDSSRERRERIEALLEEWSDKPYRNLVAKNLKAWVSGHEAVHISGGGGFCSELVAEAYKQLRLLPEGKPSIRYVPSDFGPEAPLSLLQGRLSPAYLLSV